MDSSHFLLLLIAVIQLNISFGVGIVSSLVSEGFRQHLAEDPENTYATWYCLAVAVTEVSLLQCLLAALQLFVNIKNSKTGYQFWTWSMVVTGVLQVLTLLAVIAALLVEMKREVPRAREPLEVDLRNWKISLTKVPVKSVGCLLTKYYGQCLIFLGVYWCCIPLANIQMLNDRKLHDVEMTVSTNNYYVVQNDVSKDSGDRKMRDCGANCTQQKITTNISICIQFPPSME